MPEPGASTTLVHDVNNALSVVLGNAEVIAATSQETATVTMAHEILDAGERVRDIVATAAAAEAGSVSAP